MFEGFEMSVIVTLSPDELSWSEGRIEVKAALAYCKAQKHNSVNDEVANVKIHTSTDSYGKLKYDAKIEDPLKYHVLILSVYAQFQIIGYMLGKDCIREEWYDRRQACHFVAQQDLMQICHCPCEIPEIGNDIVF
jgi:hypothetical protein